MPLKVSVKSGSHCLHPKLIMLVLYNVMLIITCSFTGVLCQSFSPPTGEICPGYDVTFTCVVDILTHWTITPGGDDGECLYSSSAPQPDMCGPGGRFVSSPTDVNEDINNSSLSVDSITVDLNGTLVECGNATNDPIDSYNICIVGKIKHNHHCM